MRWWYLMYSQKIYYPVSKSFLAYFGSMYIGFLTPGRLGEFIKAIHVSVDSGVSTGQALSSVLADRLFDLLLLIIAGGFALASVAMLNTWQSWVSVGLLVGGLTLALALLVTDKGFDLLHTSSSILGQKAIRLCSSGSWLFEMRVGLRQLSGLTILIAIALTMTAYAIFFGQCYLLALALRLPVTFASVSYAVVLGSLVTLLPISISGLGTRDAVIIAYLKTVGISAEAALSFSLLMFVTFYIGGGLMGTVAWWIKPVVLTRASEGVSRL